MRVCLVNDEPLFCEALGYALQRVGGVEVVGTAVTAEAGLRKALEMCPDVVVTGVPLGPGLNGIEVGLEVKRARPETGVVLLDHHVFRDYFHTMVPREMAAGWAYLLRKSTPDVATLLQAMSSVTRGLMVLAPQVSQAFSSSPGWRLTSLTPRELEVLQLIAEGNSNTAIAARLFLSGKSVENHITNLYEKLNLRQDGGYHPRVQAVRIYLESRGLPAESEREAD
ncbi:MAG TPA: response regulator transcription factor [Symbiobacteriaceae bacterium]|nr:response regulator transcription factor [Symbiobacteriaceae bacterium]